MEVQQSVYLYISIMHMFEHLQTIPLYPKYPRIYRNIWTCLGIFGHGLHVYTCTYTLYVYVVTSEPRASRTAEHVAMCIYPRTINYTYRGRSGFRGYVCSTMHIAVMLTHHSAIYCMLKWPLVHVGRCHNLLVY